MFKRELEADVEIAASAERVWQLITDFAAFPEWNPFIRRASGELRPGEHLVVRIQPSGARPMTFRATVLTAAPQRELSWLGHLAVPGLFDGEHHLVIKTIGPERVHFSQREVFRGVLAPFLLRLVGQDTLRGFTEMNRALKSRAETGA